MARNACGLALLALLTLSGCSAFSDKKEEQAAKEAEAKLATIRARTDSLRKARHLADSLAQVRHVACVDSVRSEMVKMSAPAKTKSKKKKKMAAPSEEMILAQAQNVCGQEAAAPQTTVAVAQPAADSVPAAAPPPPGTALDSVRVSPAATPVATAPAQAEPVPPANDSLVWADSVRKAKEIEMSRETFSYGGAARDPFNSLLNMAKTNPSWPISSWWGSIRTSGRRPAVWRSSGRRREASGTSCAPAIRLAVHAWCRSVTVTSCS